MIIVMLRRVWRVVVLIVATLCFLLALFFNYDGLGQALGLNAALAGPTGRIVLATFAAVAIALVVARLGRPKRETVSGGGRATVRRPKARGAKAGTKSKTNATKAGKAGSAKKPATKKTVGAKPPVPRRAKGDRPAAARPPARSPSHHR